MGAVTIAEHRAVADDQREAGDLVHLHRHRCVNGTYATIVVEVIVVTPTCPECGDWLSAGYCESGTLQGDH